MENSLIKVLLSGKFARKGNKTKVTNRHQVQLANFNSFLISYSLQLHKTNN